MEELNQKKGVKAEDMKDEIQSWISIRISTSVFQYGLHFHTEVQCLIFVIPIPAQNHWLHGLCPSFWNLTN
jgi:hypothetical protein